MSGALINKQADLIRRAAVKRGELTTVEGDAPLVLTRSAEWKAHELTVYGKSARDGDATPETPFPITSVDGQLKTRGGNLFDWKTSKVVDVNGIEQPTYGTIIDGVYTNQQSFYSAGVQLTLPSGTVAGGRTYTISFQVLSPSTQDIYFGFRNTAGVRTNTSQIVSANVLTSLTMTVTIPPGYAYNQYMQLQGSSRTNPSNLNIQFSNISLALGSSALPYTPYRSPLTLAHSTLDGLRLLSTATSYTYTDSAGDKRLADTWEWLPQGIWRHTQRVQTKVFDGTDGGLDVYISSPYSGFYWVASNMKVQTRDAGMCSHLPNPFALGTQPCVWFGVNNNVVFFTRMTSYVGDTIQTVRAWLAAQYAAGTPLTIKYPLASPIVTYYSELPVPLINNFEDAYIDDINSTVTPYIKLSYYKEVTNAI